VRAAPPEVLRPELSAHMDNPSKTASVAVCPECSHHPPLVRESTELLCQSCGYVQDPVHYNLNEDFRDADQNWNGLPQEEVRVLRDFSGRTLGGMGVDTSKTELRRKQQIVSV
jgi:hypothetical protein